MQRDWKESLNIKRSSQCPGIWERAWNNIEEIKQYCEEKEDCNETGKSHWVLKEVHSVLESQCTWSLENGLKKCSREQTLLKEKS